MDYFEYRKSKVSCPKCAWSGFGHETRSQLTTLDAFEHGCPGCGERLEITAVPAAEEAQELTDVERQAVEKSERAHRAYLAATLRSPEQLPELEGDTLVLEWDHVQEPDGAHLVIRTGERIVWQEPAYFECFRRFGEIAHLLTLKFGPRLADLVPTEASLPYLYGDEITAERRVALIRRRIAEDHEE